MSSATRAWLMVGLAALVAAAALHTLVLLGVGAVWSAMVHLTVFGWTSALIVAVSRHALPMFTGKSFPQQWMAWAQLAAFVPGVTLAAAGLVQGYIPITLAGLGLELLAALLFAAHALLLHTRGKLRGAGPMRPPIAGIEQTDGLSTAATLAGAACLPLALALMAAGRAGVLRGEWWLAGEHLAALGWVMLTIVGIALRVLPRFTGKALRGVGWARAQLVCHAAALVLMAAALGLGLPRLFAAGGVLMAVATALFASTVGTTIDFGLGSADIGVLHGRRDPESGKAR
ncbi:MAG: hypothetical protein RLZZ387_812 [Chloroflexota bacterium]